MDPTHLDVALAQLTNRGTLDTAFGTNGQTLLKLGTSSASSSSLRASASLRAQQSVAAQALGVLAQQKAENDRAEEMARQKTESLRGGPGR